MNSPQCTALNTHTEQQQRTESSPDGITAKLWKYTLLIFYLNDRAETAYPTQAIGRINTTSHSQQV
jgi:hypothetical protein